MKERAIINFREIMMRTVAVLVVLVSSILLFETMTGIGQDGAERLHLRLPKTRIKNVTPPTKLKDSGKTKVVLASFRPLTSSTTKSTTSMETPTSSSLTTTTTTTMPSRIRNTFKVQPKQNTNNMFNKRLKDDLHQAIQPGDENQPNKTIILIVAYLRSGSTFTASLFSRLPDTFFVFEPLHMLHKRSLQKQHILFLNGTKRTFPEGLVNQDQSRVYLESWMGCRFHEIDKDSLLDGFHKIYAINSTKSFLFCVKHRRYHHRPTLHAIKDCLPRLEVKCNMADRRVFKTIRLSMKSAESLMENYPNLKVIHLVRDPRGMFLSQMTEGLTEGSLKDYVKNYCLQVAKDVEVAKRVLKFNKKNLMLVRYEDIATDPFGEAEKLYKFAGVEFSDELKAYVNRSTSQNLKDDCNYCTTRGNSTKTAFKWREKITPLLLNIINQHCSGVMKEMGYIKINKFSGVRNLSLPSINI